MTAIAVGKALSNHAVGEPQGEAPFLSVLLPCWNAEDSILRAIRSVLELRSATLECIVIDDGSTDGTPDLVAAVAAHDPRVRLIRNRANSGVSAARNAGLDAARGSWLTMLDADDRFLPGGLETLVAATRRTGARAVVGQQVWSDGRRTWLSGPYANPDVQQPGRTSLGASPALLYFVSPHAKVFRRDTFEGLRFEGRVLGDQPWIIRALLRSGDGIEVIDETVYEWFRPPADAAATSITHTSRSLVMGGIQATQVAARSLAAVSREADRLLAPAVRDRLLAVYVERIVRYDLGVHLRAALGRGDPDTAGLLDAFRSFVISIPPTRLASTSAAARYLLGSPLAWWGNLDAPAREAYWRLSDTVRRADPELIARTDSLPLRLALDLVGRSRSPAAVGLAGALVTIDRVIEAAGRLGRRIRTAGRVR